MSLRPLREGVGIGRLARPAWDVAVDVRCVPGLPPLTGAHELAWGHILDRVFADAYRARVALLHCVVPTAELAEAARLRGELTRPPGGASGTALALLGGGEQVGVEDGLRRLYTLEAGRLAPRGLRRALPARRPDGWSAETCTSLFALQARLLGLPIRAWGGLRRPDLADRATCRMHRAFVRDGRTPAFYHLRTWMPA